MQIFAENRRFLQMHHFSWKFKHLEGAGKPQIFAENRRFSQETPQVGVRHLSRRPGLGGGLNVPNARGAGGTRPQNCPSKTWTLTPKLTILKRISAERGERGPFQGLLEIHSNLKFESKFPPRLIFGDLTPRLQLRSVTLSSAPLESEPFAIGPVQFSYHPSGSARLSEEICLSEGSAGVSPKVLQGSAGFARDFPRVFGGSDPMLVTLRNCP